MKIPLGAFLDIQRAFDRTSFGSIAKASNQYGVECTICRWISFMLVSRSITFLIHPPQLSDNPTSGII
jgi:hypothetical protein